ncbi:FAD-dependent oxidoreductase [Streptomyces sp. SL13]|uniref:FAD-dependent oxidoreductase n=1 Tax=Streptantibioticus silvisoli TaxID=2705255 RepID=A0AA90KFL7_9ACTN|nr:FAD-dependent oxidoreductase [Streptantibioticus silvisoli]MDI5967690.1 FAD-dependent oxidoreductase [Streptantibioticus silvisoli]MDI5969450.1 FAD-dependent oxidoreductase [Streptantibioticus silvisoli]
MAERRMVLRAGAGAAAAAVLAGCSPRGATRGTGAAAPVSSSSPVTTASASRSAAPPGPADWTALGRDLHGTLVRPDDADYATARLLYNTRYDGLRPAALAYVADTADIAACLAYARRAGVPVSVRGGGHSYAGWSSGNGRLVIDVSRLSRVTASGATATVGAGARLIDVYDTLGARGVTIPAGSCPTVGAAGLTLGGGHGVASRAYGLTCDNLTGATLVTADGTVLDADAGRHSDLFWALRGAGNGNFGVVTELRYRTHAAPACVTGYLTWPWSAASRVIAAWQDWGPDQADEIWSSLHLDAAPGGEAKVSIAAFSLGSYDDLSTAVDRLADHAGRASSVSLLRHASYAQAMNAYAGCTDSSEAACHLPGSLPGRDPHGRLSRDTYTARSDFYDRSLSPAGIAALIGHTENLTPRGAFGGGGAGSVALTALGGAVNRVPVTATAFTHRTSRFLAQYLASGALSGSGWLNSLYTAMRPYASGGAYQNYADPQLRDWRSAYYGPAASRLSTVKRTYDPHRVFDFPQAI